MLTEYLPVLFLLFLGLVVGGVMLGLSWWIGPRTRAATIHDSPYECGVLPTGDARRRFDVKFYLVAMLFILFDVEIVFLFPGAVLFHTLGGLELLGLALFLAILVIGLAYEWRKGALEWD